MVKVAIKNWQSNLMEEVILMALKTNGPVHDSPVARDDVAKVLDLECSLEA